METAASMAFAACGVYCTFCAVTAPLKIEGLSDFGRAVLPEAGI
jgi:hypothetical protein